MTIAYIGIGTNLGKRISNVRLALKLLANVVEILAVSSLYETEPEGYADQPDYLNCAAAVETDMSAVNLLKCLQAIEVKMGRKASFTNAPRIIDLDILIFGGEIIQEPTLTVPHARLHERAFALIPLIEIAADLNYPGNTKRLATVLSKLDSAKRVKKLAGHKITRDRRDNVPHIG